MLKFMFNLVIVFSQLSFGFSQVDYGSEIQPIFNSKCISCHGDSESAGLDISSYDNLMDGGNNGDVIIPFNHENSELWIRINSGQMPPGNNDLTDNQVDIIAQWIDEGGFEQPAGCMDPEAYNCAGSLNGDYVTDIGGIIYDNSCASCESGDVCDGYYDPDVEVSNGMCYYYQAPVTSEVDFTIESGSISFDWSEFSPPELSNVIDYRIIRCTGESCEPPVNTEDTDYTDVFNFDENDDLKYIVSVNYENNPYWGWANSEPLHPFNDCAALGDLNADGTWNVLDIVALANCVLASSCEEQEHGCAGDMNGDGTWNVLDIVALANCVLASNCG